MSTVLMKQKVLSGDKAGSRGDVADELGSPEMSDLKKK